MAIFIMFGVWMLVAEYLQLVLGLSPMEAGLWGIPSSAAFIVGSMSAPHLVRRVRPAIIMGGGMVVALIGALFITRVTASSGIAIIVVGMTIMGLAMSPVVTLATDLVVGSAPPERAGAASAISETSAEFGGALSIAILGSIGTAVYRRTMATTHVDGVAPDAVEAARSTLGGAVSVAERLPEHLGAELLTAARDAFTHALGISASVSAVVALLTAVIAVVALRRVQPRDHSESAAAA
jgi:DHA2 family multidrug resistance protein-like MFS transporter